MRKKTILSVILVFFFISIPSIALATENNNTAPMIEQSEDEVGVLGTVTGNAGSSWVNLNRTTSKKSQASFGSSSKSHRMVSVAWTLTYSDGKSKTGMNFPFSKSWSNEHVQSHNSAGTKTVVLSGAAVTPTGRTLVLLNPSSSAYIY
ncbi:hypothetical protein J2T56_001064 [Natronobacillus azotifigens]|uniref:Uncharacterized protein n=1 Tax=Natronobacillus azotifigens TaxID=472978 RepID=A0A9J6RAM3_9BACI|nr:hypothetical protein [Natronobacillus azotifigens]MCZ0702730.1 hypothetical protein [Natronobacillus azotifigens]